MLRSLGILTSTLLLSALVAVPPAAAAPAQFDVAPRVKQLVVVTSGGWDDTQARLHAYRRIKGGWKRVRGPVPVSLGWNGWVRARDRRQGTGTTPAGSFALPSAFGVWEDPGTALDYRRVDRNDMWPYEPRDPATYNILQPFKAAKSRWRADYYERLRSYGYEYGHGVVVGFNLPGGVHWSKKHKQWVARRPADTARGGGIFLHVKRQQNTAGCVSMSKTQMRWLTRWLDPDLNPRVVMGPRRYVRSLT